MTEPSPPPRGPSPQELAWQGTTLEGDTFGQVRIETLLAVRRGEAVYSATQVESEAKVLARLAIDGAGVSGFRERHAVESRKVAAIAARVPHLARVVASGAAKAANGELTPFLVTEGLEGKTLRRQLDERAIGGASLEEALVIFKPVVTALSALHQEGLAHRAFSPECVVFAESRGQSTTKVTDLCIGVDDTSPEPTPRLTPEELRYAAPEHFKKSYGPTCAATDVLALALVVVEFLAGAPALTSSDPLDLYLESTNLQRRPSPRARGVSSSDAVESVFARALAVDPKKRFQDAAAFWDALKVASEDRTSRVTLAPRAATPAEASDARRRERREKNLKRTLAFGALFATFLGGMGLTLYVRSHGARTASSATAAPSAPLALPAPSTNGSPDAALAAAGDAGGAGGATAATSDDAGAPGPPGEGAMVRVPAATFPMGSDKETRAEKPMHKVVLTRAFSIDALEVTALAYESCVVAKKCSPPLVHFGAGSDPLQKGCNVAALRPKNPANCIDQLQAQAYCAFAEKRLPTEAEWELAARGTDARDYPWGDSAPRSCAQGILRGLSGPCEKKLETFDVGLTPEGKSPFAVWDMSGNVWEWVADGFADYPVADATDPFVAPGAGADAKGVLRGGSFDYAVTVAKTTSRLALLRTAGHVSTGFRCAKSL